MGRSYVWRWGAFPLVSQHPKTCAHTHIIRHKGARGCTVSQYGSAVTAAFIQASTRQHNERSASPHISLQINAATPCLSPRKRLLLCGAPYSYSDWASSRNARSAQRQSHRVYPQRKRRRRAHTYLRGTALLALLACLPAHASSCAALSCSRTQFRGVCRALPLSPTSNSWSANDKTSNPSKRSSTVLNEPTFFEMRP